MTKKDLIEFSKKIESLWAAAEIPFPVHIAGGNEDQLIDIFREIKPQDYIYSTHRSHYHYLLAGGSPAELENMILQGKSMHVFDRKLNFLASSIVGGMCAIAVGTALALKRKKSDAHVWCFAGDGAEDEGHFYEAVRYVDGWQLPCTFILEDNDRSVETPKKDRYGTSEIQWPACVRRYHYTSAYSHVGVGRWVDFSKMGKRQQAVHAEPSYERVKTGNLPLFKGTYKQAIEQSMLELAENPASVFLGYNINYGSMAYGTLAKIPVEQKIEMPVAENLMMGLATGLAVEGFRPVVFFERQDFILNALDQIVNHLDKIMYMSDNQFDAPVIIRATVGAKQPLDPGPQHLGDYSEAFEKMIKYFPVYYLNSADEVAFHYKKAASYNHPVMFIEQKEFYDKGAGSGEGLYM